VKKIIFIILSFQVFAWAPAWGDQQSYLDCKQQALQNLATRYTQFFERDTGGATGAGPTVRTFMNDYQGAVSSGCSGDHASVEYMNCLDGAINSAATRFSTQFTSRVNTTGNTQANNKFQEYQNDYANAEIQCRSQLATNNNCAVVKQTVANECTSASQSATSSCNPNENSSLMSLKNSFDNISSSGGIQQACQQVASMSDQGTQAVNSYSATCSAQKNTCISKCQAALNSMSGCEDIQSSPLYQAVHTSLDSCSVLQAKTAEAQQQVQSFQSTKQSALNCSNQTGGAGTNGNGTNDPSTAALAGLTQAAMAALNQPAASPTPVDPSLIPSTDPNSPYCQANPTVAGCVADCSRTDLPQIASSHTCICFRNPSDPSCTSAAASGLQLSSLSPGGGVGATNTAAASDLNLSGMDGGFQGFQTNPSNGNPGQEIGGKQGNGADIGGPSSLTPGGNAAGGGAGLANDATPRMTFYGGGGSGSAFSNGFGSGGGSGGGGGGAYAVGNGGSTTANQQNGPDLRQFLPGGKLDPAAKRRGIAGVSGPDGITGPDVENWNKIQNRYRFLESSLLP
jgi:hypothetical protein